MTVQRNMAREKALLTSRGSRNDSTSGRTTQIMGSGQAQRVPVELFKKK